MAEHLDPEMEALIQQIANLPLEDFVTLFMLLKPSLSTHGKHEVELYSKQLLELRNAITTGGLKTFPMDGEHIRQFFILSFSIHNELLSRVEDLEERVKELNRYLEAMEIDINYLDHDLAKVEYKVKH